MTNIIAKSTLVPASDDEFAPSVWGDFFVTYVPPVSQACMQHIYNTLIIYKSTYACALCTYVLNFLKFI